MPEMVKKLSSGQDWAQVFDDNSFKSDLEGLILPIYIRSCRWFAGKSSIIKQIRIKVVLPIHLDQQVYYILILEVGFKGSVNHQYLLPIAFIPTPLGSTAISKLNANKKVGFIYDAFYVPVFRELLFKNILKNKIIQTGFGSLKFETIKSFTEKPHKKIESQILKAEQSNTAVIFNDQYFFKWYRRVFPEENPDLEMSRFLNRNHFKYTAQFLGSISWNRPNKPPISIGLLQQKLTNQGDAWAWMLNEVNRFFDHLNTKSKTSFNYQPKEKIFSPIKPSSLPMEVKKMVGGQVIENIVLIGTRTAQMHLTLARGHQDSDFKPIHFDIDYSVWLKNKTKRLFENRIRLLEKNLTKLQGLGNVYGQTVLDRRQEILKEIKGFDNLKLNSLRTRVHGDFHLGQMLIHDMDFYILDFEGEPESTIRDRKVKQSPLKDVAGMLRSFHYAIYATLFDESKKWTRSQSEHFEIAERLYQLVCGLFLHGFIKSINQGGLSIGYRSEIQYLLRYHLLEKAIYELGYELNSRPSWAMIPLRGIMKIMGYY